ncbi:MAG: type II secretion system protein J [Sphingomonas sp.]
MSAVPNRRPPGARGFALVELLVSLALLAMVAVMLASGVALARNLASRAASDFVHNETIVTAQAILRDRLETLVPSARVDLGKPVADIRGTPDGLSFFAPPPPAERPGTLRRYRLRRTPGGQLILYSIADVSSRAGLYAPGERGWAQTPLLYGVAELRTDYFGSTPPDDQRRWRAQWINQTRPPELIRIRVALAAGDRRQWPDMIVRPAVTINAACRIVPTTGKCAGQ